MKSHIHIQLYFQFSNFEMSMKCLEKIFGGEHLGGSLEPSEPVL